MNKLSKRTIGKRITAAFLAWILFVSILPMPSIQANAATAEHPNCVTVTVKDSDSNPVEGATVVYTVEKDPNATDGVDFATISSTATTDVKGVAVVLMDTEYVDGLLFSATVTKNGYASATVSSTALAGADQNIDVSLLEPEIEGVVVTALDGTYIENTDQALITKAEATTQGVTIEYSEDGSAWSSEIPKKQNAGEYPVYVKMTKDGYQDYLSGKLTAKIAKKDITDISIAANELKYNGADQNLVTMTGTFKDGDVITWLVDNVDTGSENVPQKTAIGTYKVKLQVDRGSNYNVLEQEVSVKIDNGTLDIAGLKVEAYNGQYDGAEHDALSLEGEENFEIKYKYTDDESVDPSTLTWGTSMPKVTNAGNYRVWMQVTKEFYETKVLEYKATVSPKPQSVKFDVTEYNNTNLASPLVDTVDITELSGGKTYNFSASGAPETSEYQYTITYSVEAVPPLGDEEKQDISTIVSIDEYGVLRATGACEVIVNATITQDIVNVGDPVNYATTTIQCYLTIECAYAQVETGLKLEHSSISYIVGNVNGIPTNIATKVNSSDSGKITYTVDKGEQLGLEAKKDEQSGNWGIVVTDYHKLISAVEDDLDGTLAVTIKVNKAKVTNRWGRIRYAEINASYPLNITLHTTPSSAYTVYSVEDSTTPITAPNGTNGWYNTALSVVPVAGYNIIRADELTGSNVTFGTSATFGQKAEDQGYIERAVYLQDATTKEITGKIVIADITKIDTAAPVINFIYNDSAQEATITVTDVNFDKEKVSVSVEATDISGNAITLPTNDYFQQYLRTCTWNSSGDKHTATISDEFVDAVYKMKLNCIDIAGNSATEYSSGQFMVDKQAPSTADMSVSYSVPLHKIVLTNITFGFYNPDVTVTFAAADSVSGIDYFTVMYDREDDVSDVNLEEYAETLDATPADSTNDKTKFTASMTLPQSQADQLRGMISFTATDNLGNTSNVVTDDKNVIIVDTIAPNVTVEFSEPDLNVDGKSYYSQNLVATFKVTEANFYEEDFNVLLIKDDNTSIPVEPTWNELENDVYEGIYCLEADKNLVGDGNYVFSVSYKDKSNNAWKIGNEVTYLSDTMIIDTTKPQISVSYSNNSPKNTLIDAEGKSRKYFSDTMVATVKIVEHNFYEEGVEFDIVAKDAAGNVLSNTDSLYSKSEWVHDGDNHTIKLTYPGDANYTFDIRCKDLAESEAEDYAPDYFTVDKSKPTDLKISYNTSVLDTILTNISFGFYNTKAVVKVSATDNISGIYSFKYSYVNAPGVSSVNAQLVDVIAEESRISHSNGKAMGTVEFEIPKDALGNSNQFNGTIKFVALDRANNESDTYSDSKRIVVDNITPTATVQYNTPVQVIDNVSYYDGNITASVVINEANFYQEDVKIEVTRDGAAHNVNTLWNSEGTDVHTGTFTLSQDGDYFVKVSYMDKSKNAMQEYTSEQMTIDTDIAEPTVTINGSDGNGKAYKEDVSINVNFEDTNYESYELKLSRVSYADKNVDVTDKFVATRIKTNATGGSGTFATFDKTAENDGIYTLTVTMKDKAGHTAETSVIFTVNRFGSVYEYSDYLAGLIKDGGSYVQDITEDLIITEYNADKLLSDSLRIEISKDGKPLDDITYKVTPEINDTVAIGESGWFQYKYIISKDNFNAEGIYKISISSKDATGNSPENNNYKDKEIIFRVDRTVPEITSITGLEEKVINATEREVKYTVFDAIGIKAIAVYVDEKPVASVTDFSEDANNYTGSFIISESTSAQHIRIVVTDMAGNVTDTSSDEFTSIYAFNDSVTVSTNVLVRLYANKAIFFGSIAAVVVGIGGAAGGIFLYRRKKIVK